MLYHVSFCANEQQQDRESSDVRSNCSHLLLTSCLSPSFSWEEYSGVPDLSGGSRPRLVAVGSGCDLKLLEVEAERSVSISVLCVSDCPADHLLKTVWQQDHSEFSVSLLRPLC